MFLCEPSPSLPLCCSTSLNLWGFVTDFRWMRAGEQRGREPARPPQLCLQDLFKGLRSPIPETTAFLLLDKARAFWPHGLLGENIHVTREA